jgi:hypothetical protein
MNELIKQLKEYYGDDRNAILRKLQDILNIPLEEAEKLLS